MTANTPIKIEPGTFLIDSAQINKKPSAAKIVSVCVKSPKLKNVTAFDDIMPPFFKPINPMNNPTPAP